MAEPLVRSSLPRVLLTAATLVFASSCVTRTVYVVDDRDAPVASAPQAAPQAAPLATAPPRGGDVVGPEEFYEPLAPYGTWHSHPRYGYVWAPAGGVVGAGWRPYTRGHWEYTEWGWTWVSDLPFGWATFHYGRWFYDASYGWVWVPGTQWAPAWVTWRTGGGYVGWAPMPPGAVYGASYTVYDTAWIFVSTGNFGAPLIYPVIVTGSYYRNCLVVTRPYRTTYVAYGSTYYRGPDPDRVRREGGRVVHRPIRDVDADRPTTRPPRGVRVSTVGHGGHDGSVGSRRGDRGDRGGNDRATPRDRDDRPGRGDGRGDGRGRGDDRVSDRGDRPDQSRGGGRGDGRGDGPGRGNGDGRVDDPRGSDGRPVANDGRGGSRGPGLGEDRGQPGRGGDRGIDRGTDVPRVPPGVNDGTPGGRVPPGIGNGGGRGDGGSRGGDGSGSNDDDGVPANKDVVRPDRGEVRPPSDNPYNSNPGSSGRGGIGAQTAPPAGAQDGARPGPADSRFGRRLPSRFGTPTAPSQRPAPSAPALTPPRGPSVAPPAGTPAPGTPAPSTQRPLPSRTPNYGVPGNGVPGNGAPGYGAPSQRPVPGYGRPAAPGGAGRIGPAPTPSRQQPGAASPRPSQAPRYTAPSPAPRQAPAARSQSNDRKEEKKRTQSKKGGEREQKRQPRSRR